MVFFLKNSTSLEYIPDALANDSSINQAFEFANEAAMTRKALEIQFQLCDFIILQFRSLALLDQRR